MKTLRKSLLMGLTALFAVAVALFAIACSNAVGYTVEVYLASEGSYVLSEEYSTTGSGTVGESLTVEAPEVEGYVLNSSHEGTVATLTLSSAANENVYRFYYDVATYGTVAYNANAPRGASLSGRTPDTATDAQGKAAVAENGYSIRGYRFAGWSTRSDGKVEYRPGDPIVVGGGTTTLYAIWDRGYADRFGGTDYIFLPSLEEGVAYLSRGGREFKGTVDGETFSFDLPSGDKLVGRTFSSWMFTFRRDSIVGTYYYYNNYYLEEDPSGSNPSARLDKTNILTVDEYGGATHTYVDGEQTVTDTGTIIYNAATDEYLFTDEMGNGFVYTLAVLPGNDPASTEDDVLVFQQTFGEGGLYYEFITPDGYSGAFGSFDLTLDGYGGITFYDWFSGPYEVEEAYGNATVYLYKIKALIGDPYHIADTLDLVDQFGYSFFGEEPAETLPGEDGTDVDYWRMDFYVMPLDGGYYGYVLARDERGEWKNEGESETLTLDGYGNFGNSAKYVDEEGHEYLGTYTISLSPRTAGTFVHFRGTDQVTGAPTGENYEFLLNEGKFELRDTGPHEDADYTEYIWLNDGNLDYSPLLVVYEDDVTGDAEAVLGKRTEIYLNTDPDGLNLELGARGYLAVSDEMTFENGVTMYTFHRTELVLTDHAAQLYERIDLMLDQTFDSNYVTRDVYYTFARQAAGAQEEKLYTVIADEEANGAQLWYMPVGVNTLGSLYRDEDGNWYQGGLTIDTNSYYFGTMGIFLWYDPVAQRYNTVYFDITPDNSGNPATFREVPETEYPLYRISSTGTFDTNVTLIARGDEALYSPSGNFEGNAGMRGTLRSLGYTVLGEVILAFVNTSGVEVFRFIAMPYDYSELGGAYVTHTTAYIVYDAASKGEFRAADGSTLSLDGYHGAVYTPAGGGAVLGTYSLSEDGDAVNFRADNGNEQLFSISADGTLDVLDGAYGEWQFTVHGETLHLRFNGHGVVEAYDNRGRQVGESGFYEIVSDDPLELTIFIDLEYGPEAYTIRFVTNIYFSECVILNEGARGVFVDENWAVITLDGYGSGVYYAADGSAGRSGALTILDSRNHFAMLRDDAGFTDLYFSFDTTNGTFRLPAYSRESYIYFTPQFEVIAFGNTGMAQVDNTTGVYDIVGDVVRVYTASAQTGGYTQKEYPRPTGADVYVADGKTYYRYRGEKIVLDGTIEIDAEGFENITGATLTFTLDSSDVTSGATLAANGQSYDMTLVTQYWDSSARRYIRGTALFDLKEYNYYPITTNYVPEGIEGVAASSVFTAKGGVQSFRFIDYNEDETTGSSITESYTGFGPIRLTDPVVAGDLNYGGVHYSFTGAKGEELSYNADSNVTRTLVVFEQGGKKYALSYEKDIDGYYTLYRFSTYSEIESGDYVIGIHRHLYTNEGYTFFETFAEGDFCDVTLYKKEGAGRKIVTALFSKASKRLSSAWLMPVEGNNAALSTGTVYDISFTFGSDGDDSSTTATVTEKKFVQAMTAGNSGNAYVNFFVDSDNKPTGIFAYMSYNSENYIVYMDIATVEKVGEDDWKWKVTDSEGHEFLVTVELGRDGRPQADRTGSWLITVGSPEPAGTGSDSD